MTVDELIAKLEAAIPKATAGPWTIEDMRGSPLEASRFENGAYQLFSDSDCEHHAVADFSCNHSCRDDQACLENALYVEAAQPENIAALITAYRELALKVEQYYPMIS